MRHLFWIEILSIKCLNRTLQLKRLSSSFFFYVFLGGLKDGFCAYIFHRTKIAQR